MLNSKGMNGYKIFVLKKITFDFCSDKYNLKYRKYLFAKRS